MHHIIKEHSVAAWLDIKEKGKNNNLFERLAVDDEFPLDQDQLEKYLQNPERYAGAAIVQTEEFLRDVVDPKLKEYKKALDAHSESELAV